MRENRCHSVSNTADQRLHEVTVESNSCNFQRQYALLKIYSYPSYTMGITGEMNE
jgi:hypothetical protein